MFSLIKVAGDSMSPALTHGDIVLCKNVKPAALRCGFIYVVNHSDLGCIIKRLGPGPGNRYSLSGDNPASAASPLMGTVEPARITRRAILRISKRGLKKL